MFCDKVTVSVKAGNGGDGVVSFLHEKYREFGGPDGGDGGKGGDVIFQADESQNTLYFYKTHHNIAAKNGERGKGRKKHGRNGDDLIMKVPPGTVITEAETGREIGDLSEKNSLVVAKGGAGGYGNAHFTSSTRQAPRVSELGEPGEEKNVILEMKMIADVGLVGLPNVGKSTLLSVISSAKPKIADYEFTTLIPNLGVVEGGRFGVEKGFVVADIPGLIEGASKGRGLGDEFLRHIERTKLLVHIIDGTHADVVSDYKTIKKELKFYQIDLSQKPQIVVLNKIDCLSVENLEEKLKSLEKAAKGDKILKISAAAHTNLKELINEAELQLSKQAKSQKSKAKSAAGYKVFGIEDVVDQDIFSVEKKKKHFIIHGNKIEKFAIRTDFENEFGLARFRDILKKQGIDRELRRAGATAGVRVKVVGKEFIF